MFWGQWLPWKIYVGFILFQIPDSGLILGLRPANERWCYFVTTSLIGWAQTLNQLWYWLHFYIPYFSSGRNELIFKKNFHHAITSETWNKLRTVSVISFQSLSKFGI